MDGFVIATAYLLDLLLGDPLWLPHPVRLIGLAISTGERGLRSFVRTPAAERAAGALLTGAIVAASYGAAWWAIRASLSFNNYLGIALAIYLASTTLAVDGLAAASRAVLAPLRQGNLREARQKLALIVGRDTGDLDETNIIRAVVETIAENASDGVIAPLFYLALGGPALAVAYKAVNTLDSMIGHKNDRYRYFGWAAARLDDVANFIPSRLTAVLICLGAEIMATTRLFNWQSTIGNTKSASWRIMIRDGAKHPSPNSGWPEAAMAGVLGVQLGGISTYGGVLFRKPCLGDPVRELGPDDIDRAILLLYATSLVGTLVAATTRFCGP